MSKARSHDLCPLPFGMRSRTPFPLGVLQRRRSSWEGGRHGSPINFNTSFWSIFNQATSQCSPSTFQIHSHPILHHRYLEEPVEKGNSQLTFSNAATQIPHIILIQVAVGTLELAPQVNDKSISNKTIQNHTKPSCPERSN